MAGLRKRVRSSPAIGQFAVYRTLVVFEDTLFHIVMVDVPTALIALSATIKIRASISPYSTAVAALVDRSSL
jgi:hypothetical protein